MEELKVMTIKTAPPSPEYVSTQVRSSYGSDPATITTCPSIHPSGLLQWQAGEFDREVPQAVEEQRHRPCARRPQDCAGEDWGPGEWDKCPHVKSGGRTPCGWKA